MPLVFMCEQYISRYHRWRRFGRSAAIFVTSLYLSLLFLAVFLQSNYVNPIILGLRIQIPRRTLFYVCEKYVDYV